MLELENGHYKKNAEKKAGRNTVSALISPKRESNNQSSLQIVKIKTTQLKWESVAREKAK